MLSLVGIVIALGLLIFFAMKGFNILWMAPILSCFVILVSGMDLVTGLTTTYMAGFVGFASKYYLVFLFGAVYAKLMEDSGAAKSIAYGIMKLVGEHHKFAMLFATMIITAVLTYGGVSLFVVVFAVMPIMRPIYKKMDIPWPVFLGAMMTGSGTFTMTCLPGTPQIQNVIPATILGTPLTAAPVVGIVGAIVVIAFDMWWLNYDLKKLTAKGIGFEATKGSLVDVEVAAGEVENLPNLIVALIPMAGLLILLNLVKLNIVLSLIAACIMCLVFMFPYYKNILKTVNQGAFNVCAPIVNTCAIVGFGTVVGATVGYQYLVSLLVNMPGNPLISWTIGVNALAGITGSASGGLTIAMNTLAPLYIDKVNPELLHRIGSIASGGLDSLPHNGAVITTLMVVGLTHKQGYKYVGMTCTVGPIIASIFAIIVGIMIY